jgi:hypothetical protein
LLLSNNFFQRFHKFNFSLRAAFMAYFLLKIALGGSSKKNSVAPRALSFLAKRLFVVIFERVFALCCRLHTDGRNSATNNSPQTPVVAIFSISAFVIPHRTYALFFFPVP